MDGVPNMLLLNFNTANHQTITNHKTLYRKYTILKALKTSSWTCFRISRNEVQIITPYGTIKPQNKSNRHMIFFVVNIETVILNLFQDLMEWSLKHHDRCCNPKSFAAG